MRRNFEGAWLKSFWAGKWYWRETFSQVTLIIFWLTLFRRTKRVCRCSQYKRGRIEFGKRGPQCERVVRSIKKVKGVLRSVGGWKGVPAVFTKSYLWSHSNAIRDHQLLYEGSKLTKEDFRASFWYFLFPNYLKHIKTAFRLTVLFRSWKIFSGFSSTAERLRARTVTWRPDWLSRFRDALSSELSGWHK